MRSISDSVILSNGVKMPWLGLGVYKAKDGSEVERAVITALETGYRSIDTAAIYRNEEGVGRAIASSTVPRDEIFVTTKVWNSDQGYQSTLKAFDVSLRKLGLDYIDLYLVHWPVKGMYLETWRALEKLYKDGKVRAIGVSNFQIHHLQDILEAGEITPMVNQVEYHPWLTHSKLHEFCKDKSIQMEAYSPLTRGEIFGEPLILELAKKYGKTPAQILLRWDLEKEVVTIPKTTNPERIRENAQIFDFNLTAEDVERIDALNRDYRIVVNPPGFNFDFS